MFSSKRQNKKAEKEFFDHYSKQKRYEVLEEKGYQKLLSEFENLVCPKKGERVIDLGCGTGAFTQRLKKLDLAMMGMDISTESIIKAKKNILDVNFLVGDIEKTGLKDNSFDIIIYSGVLHHFPDFSEVLNEGFRILKSGGRMFSYDTNLDNPIMALYRHPKSPFYSRKGLTSNERLFTRRKIEIKVKKAGFEKIKVRAVSGIPYKSVELKAVNKFLFLYNLWETLFEHLSVSKKFGSFLLCCSEKAK